MAKLPSLKDPALVIKGVSVADAAALATADSDCLSSARHSDVHRPGELQWQEGMRVAARSYFERLAAMGLAHVFHHPLSGRNFIDVTIEGRRFKGQVYDGPYVVSVKPQRGCPLANASIGVRSDPSQGSSLARRTIFKHATHARILLDGLTDRGVRALACEFGLLMREDDAAQTLSESVCFEVSKARLALLDWTERQPVMAKRRLEAFPALLERLEPRRSRFRKLEEFPYFGGS